MTDAINWNIEKVLQADLTTEELPERFTQSFLDQVGPAGIVDFVNGFQDLLGQPDDLETKDVIIWTETFGRFVVADAAMSEESSFLLTIGLDPVTGLIGTLFYNQFSPSLLSQITDGDVDLSVADAMEVLSTKTTDTAILLAEVTNDGCSSIVDHQQGQAEGIASLHRIWILGALATEIAAGSIGADDVVTLDPSLYVVSSSPFSGSLEEPVDLTVQQAAAYMMGLGDGSVTDMLHELVGPDKVDDFVRASGHTRPELLTPVLNFSELFHLLRNVSPEQAGEYLTLDDESQLAFVESELRPLGAFDGDTSGGGLIDELTWQSTPLDVCATLATLRNQFLPGSDAGDFVHEAFSSNSNVVGLRNAWDRTWYAFGGAGGSSPMTFAVRSDAFLVESQDGRTYVVVGLYDSDADVPRSPFAGELYSLNARIMLHLVEGTGL